MSELETRSCPDCDERRGCVVDFVRRLYQSVQTGADGNLSKREQCAVGVAGYLGVLACLVNMVLIAPLAGVYLAGLLTGVLFYTVRDRVRLEHLQGQREAEWAL